MSNSPHRYWQARYNKTLLQVCETEGPHIYLTLASVRQVLPKLRSDANLQRDHGRNVGVISKEDKRLYFSESALRRELSAIGTAEAIMFTEWLHLHLYCPAAKKRGEDVRPDIITGDKVQAHRSTPAPSIWLKRGHRVSLLEWVLLPMTAHWRGAMSPKQTLIGSVVLATLVMWLAFAGIEYFNNPDHYYGSWQTHRVGILALLLTISGVWVWWGIGVMRFALRHVHRGSGLAATFTVFVAGLFTMIYATALSVENGHEWLMGFFEPMGVAEVSWNPATNRIVFKGDVGFGSYKRLQRVLTENPTVKVLELDSPGGYVIEGLAMSRLIKQARLDTVAFGYCDSACTLMFAAGQERYLGPKASLGFHRSSVFGSPPSDGWTNTEFRMARYLEGRGVSREFIELAFSVPGDDLWLPKHGHMLEAGYATANWTGS